MVSNNNKKDFQPNTSVAPVENHCHIEQVLSTNNNPNVGAKWANQITSLVDTSKYTHDNVIIVFELVMS